MISSVSYPKIELHVHLEGAVRPATLLAVARRNDVALPASTVEELTALYRYTDFAHFIEVFLITTAALRTAEDFRQIVVDYAGEAASHGAVYVEGIFAPLQAVRRGVAWEELFEGYCDGVQEARETAGLEVRLTPDLTRNASPEEADLTIDYALAYRERGVVGLGLGAFEAEYPPRLYEQLFRQAREGGLGSVPHAGEVVGPEGVWEAIELLHADRLRHGIRAIEDPLLVRELAARGTVLDVCPTSNVLVGTVASLAEHPLPHLVSAGVACSLSTDDPAMFDTDLTQEYETACGLGLDARDFYDAGLAGALCDEAVRARLRAIGEAYDWDGLPRAAAAR